MATRGIKPRRPAARSKKGGASKAQSKSSARKTTAGKWTGRKSARKTSGAKVKF